MVEDPRDSIIKMAFIKEESEDMKIEEDSESKKTLRNKQVGCHSQS